MARTVDTSKSPAYRPTDYLPHYHKDMIYKLALLGCCDVEIAQTFGIAEVTLHAWLNTYEDLSKSLMEGRDIADANVSVSLYKRACGYEIEQVKIFCDKEGNETIIPYQVHIPPDTKAATIWLKNRRRNIKHANSLKWIDSNQTELTGPNGMPLYPDQTEKAKSNRETLLKEIADE